MAGLSSITLRWDMRTSPSHVGTFNALRVDATIRIEVSAFQIEAGTYTTSTWLAPDVGMVKSEGTSHVSRDRFFRQHAADQLHPSAITSL